MGGINLFCFLGIWDLWNVGFGGFPTLLFRLQYLVSINRGVQRGRIAFPVGECARPCLGGNVGYSWVRRWDGVVAVGVLVIWVKFGCGWGIPCIDPYTALVGRVCVTLSGRSWWYR